MAPLLWNGDIVHIKRVSFNSIKINDIICIRKNKKLFTHRVIYKGKKYLVTKGGANLASDGKIYQKQIIGIVNKFERNGEIFNLENIYLFQSTIYLAQILKVKEAFEREKLEFLFLKGLPLHLYYEKTHPRRIYADCDLLIKREQYDKFQRIFREYGYKKSDKRLLKNIKRSSKEQEISFFRNFKGFTIKFDVHLEVVFMMARAGRFKSLYKKELLERMTKKFLDERIMVKIQNEPFPILSSENLFIYLALHLFHHNFEGSYRYDLLRVVVKREKLNYLKIAKTIIEYKLENFIYPSLFILKRYYKVKFPSSFFKVIKPAVFVQRYTQNMNLSDIFDDKGRIGGGIIRFRNIYNFSPAPLYRKLLVFLDPQFLEAIISIIIIRLGLRKLSSD